MEHPHLSSPPRWVSLRSTIIWAWIQGRSIIRSKARSSEPPTPSSMPVESLGHSCTDGIDTDLLTVQTSVDSTQALWCVRTKDVHLRSLCDKPRRSGASSRIRAHRHVHRFQVLCRLGVKHSQEPRWKCPLILPRAFQAVASVPLYITEVVPPRYAWPELSPVAVEDLQLIMNS